MRMSVRNPFTGYGRTVVGERLVGRDAHIAALSRWLLDDDGSFSLVGMPRIGKSSVVHAVGEMIRVERPSVAMIAVDCQSFPSQRQLFDDLLERLRAEMQRLALEPLSLTRQVYNTEGDRTYESFRAFARTLEDACRQSATFRTIITLDALDRICGWPSGGDVIHSIRAIADHPQRYRASFGLVSRRRLRVIEIVLTGISTLATMCHVEFLGPLDQKALGAMAGRGQAGKCWQPSELSLVLEHTGGHPYLSEMVLYYAWETQSVESGIKRSMMQTLEFYDVLRRILEVDAMFSAWMRAAVRPRLRVADLSYQSLWEYGLLVENRPDGEGAQAWSNHAQLHLARCRREADDNDETWAIWRRTEIAIRDSIESTLHDGLGDDWEDQIARRHTTISAMIEGCRQRAENERAKFQLARGGRLLDYAYPDELWLIISCEWARFQSRFGVGKTELKTHFDAMARIRTPVAHNRVLPEAEEEAGRIACRHVFDLIIGSHSSG